MRQREQKLPPWVWAALDERLVEAAETSVEAWRRSLRRDPCAYCGGRGGDVDHITPQAHGGSDNWVNLTGACRGCNSAKGRERVVHLLIAQRHDGFALRSGTAALGNLTLAVADMNAVPGARTRTGALTNRLMEHLIEEHPETDGALLYSQQGRDRDGRPKYLHVLQTRPGKADAGAICRSRGGGGTATRGAFTATRIAVRR